MTQSGAPRKSWLDKLDPDVFGSDVFIDYTATYVWLANQFGHFGIGFGLTSLLTWPVLAFSGPGWGWLAYLFGAIVIVLYAGKEWLDLAIARRQAQGFFPFDEKELWADMFADAWFVTSGVLTALAAHADPVAGMVAAAIAIAAYLLLASWFLPAKRSLDRTALSYVFRLANFPKTEGVRAHNAARIRAFITGETVEGFRPPPAVLIQGLRGTGKSTLGVGIASEFALRRKPQTRKHGRSLYFTAFGLFERDAPQAEPRMDGAPYVMPRRKPRFLGTGDPWSVDECELLVIDDVDGDNPVTADAGAERVLAYMQEQRPDILDLVRTKQTVWISGSTRFADEGHPSGWQAWLHTLARLYGCTIDETRLGDDPPAIEAREPIPVIWLQQRLDTDPG